MYTGAKTVVRTVYGNSKGFEVKGSMSKVAKSFVCSGCLNPVTSAGRTSVDIGVSAKLELVDKFCYLGDMLSVDGDADAAVGARIRIGWNKFRQLVPLLTNKDVSLIMRGSWYAPRFSIKLTVIRDCHGGHI